MVAQAESGVTVGARTGAERTAIELAQEAHSCLGVAELEAGSGLLGRVTGHRGNTRSRRGCGVDRPRKAGGAALIASGILGLDREGVVAQAESGVALGARTGAERTAIELAKEAHARFGVGKAEGGAGLVRGVGRCGGDRRRRDRGVNGPGEAGGGALVAGSVPGLD